MLPALFFAALNFISVPAQATTANTYPWTTTAPTANSQSKAADVNDIVNAILFMENQCGMAPNSLPTVQAGDRIRATDITVLRTRVAGIYSFRGVVLPGWGTAGGNTAITTGTTIRAADLVELRTALNNPALLAACSGGSVCGNGTIEAGEQCDDSNTNSGDGCSSPACQCEYAWVNDVCAGGSPACLASQMHQTALDPDGAGACVASTRCVADATCGSGMCGCDASTPCDVTVGDEYCQADPACSPYGRCMHHCSNSIMDFSETGPDCGGVCPACPAECWGCFDGPTCTGNNISYCLSDGSIAQTNACHAGCTMPNNDCQVPVSYCAPTCFSVFANLGNGPVPSGDICSNPYTTYYISPSPGFIIGNSVYDDSACTNGVGGSLIRDGGGTIFNMAGNIIGAPTGDSC